MAGLNFQTQTIINSNLDPDSKVKSPLYKWVEKDNDVPAHLQIKRDFSFFKGAEAKEADQYGKVLRMVHKEGHEATMCKATLNFNTLDLAPKEENVNVKYYRLDIYLGVEGAEPFLFSNPWVQKGLPLWVEFSAKKGEVAADIVNRLAKTIKESHAFQYAKDLIDVNVTSPSMELVGTEEYIRFKKVDIVEFKDNEIYETKVAGIGSEGIKLTARGTNGFGTYSQIIKDLRLPTAANYQWTHIRQVETPIVGAVYDQFIIDYAAPATNEGLQCVGQRMNSVTTHVFWVKNDISSDFQGVLSPNLGELETSAPEAIETDTVAYDKGPKAKKE